MAIYLNLSDMENDLENTAADLYEYNNDKSFRSGYDTAVDVATCVNEQTAWHCTAPNDYEDLLIFNDFTHVVSMGFRRADNWWYSYKEGNLVPNAVTWWMQLPDAPMPDDSVPVEDDEA